MTWKTNVFFTENLRDLLFVERPGRISYTRYRTLCTQTCVARSLFPPLHAKIDRPGNQLSIGLYSSHKTVDKEREKLS